MGHILISLLTWPKANIRSFFVEQLGITGFIWSLTVNPRGYFFLHTIISIFLTIHR